jgi:predicted enzyme related to lactoylglutathione lyase
MNAPSPLQPFLAKLAAGAGNWRGTNRLHDPHTNAPEDSPSGLTLTPILGGTFLRVDYTWVYQGAPQEGSLLLGADPEGGAVTGYFSDTWHYANKMMACPEIKTKAGAKDHSNRLAVQGGYACPPGPDWGWRIELEMRDEPKKALLLRMLNVTPDGQAAPAVEASYAPARPAAQPGDLGQVALTFNDVPAAVNYYRDVLGLKFLFSPAPALAFLAAGRVRLMLARPEGTGAPGRNSILYLQVTDIESTFPAIVQRGARVERAPQLTARLPDHDLWIGFVRDPEDNLIGLMEEKPPSSTT